MISVLFSKLQWSRRTIHAHWHPTGRVKYSSIQQGPGLLRWSPCSWEFRGRILWLRIAAQLCELLAHKEAEVRIWYTYIRPDKQGWLHKRPSGEVGLAFVECQISIATVFLFISCNECTASLELTFQALWWDKQHWISEGDVRKLVVVADIPCPCHFVRRSLKPW